MAPSPAEAFYRRVDMVGDCWIWTGELTDYGGPILQLGREYINPMALAKELEGHEPPVRYAKRTVVCGEKRCVNPNHNHYSTVAERFWKKVEIRDENDCWSWKGARSRGTGYGSFTVGTNLRVGAHRYMYELLNGHIPEGLFVMHTCDNPICVNPHHLMLGTHNENMQDMANKKRACCGERHHKSKLTEGEVRLIRDLYQQGLTQVRLAEIFGVSQANIGYIVNFDIWRGISNG